LGEKETEEGEPKTNSGGEDERYDEEEGKQELPKQALLLSFTTTSSPVFSGREEGH
jgi:hypothetical protein